MKKKAILSIDIEDWYHLDYFNRDDCDLSYSMLDGLDVFIEFINKHNISANFFVLGELVSRLQGTLKHLVESGHDVGIHGWNHKRPLGLSLDEFRQDTLASSRALEAVTGKPVIGYRAPCFSMNRERLDVLSSLGFLYDSSRIQCVDHPLYGMIDMGGFDLKRDSVYSKNNFYEFEVSTIKRVGRSLPISGGGYIRIFPWWLMKNLVSSYLAESSIYTFYIHPFELSLAPTPTLPDNLSPLTRFRFSYGRKDVLNKLHRLVDLLSNKGYELTTFEVLRNELIQR
jgi:polysaccharide deacetylase family protein (PEP-CTERM system associated)